MENKTGKIIIKDPIIEQTASPTVKVSEVRSLRTASLTIPARKAFGIRGAR